MITGKISVHEWGEDHIVEWRIKFLTLMRDEGWYYVSPTFSFGGEIWFMRIYPNGNSFDESVGHVDLWLWKHTDRSIEQSFSLSLRTDSFKKYNELHCTKKFDKDNFCHAFTRFIPRSELAKKQSELVPDGILTVVCAMKRTTSAGNAACVEAFTQTQKNVHRQASTQTEKHVLRQASTQTEKHVLRQASTQTMGKRHYNCREKLLMALCIANIIIAVVTGCLLFYSKTPFSSSHPDREAVTKMETSEINNTTDGLKLDGSGSNEIVATDVSQSDGINKTDGLTLTAGLNAELNKVDQSEIDGSDNPVASVANQADTDESEGVKKAVEVTLTVELNAELNKTNQSEIAKYVTPEVSVANQADSTETDESEASAKLQTSVNNRSDVVGSNEFEATSSNENTSTNIMEEEGINKTSAAEINKIDKSEIAASDISEASTTNQADIAEKDESEPLPQPVLMVTEVGSTYLEVVWVLSEESKSNAAHIHFIVHFRKYGAQWQVVFFPDASKTSYTSTNLDPGMSYQIYVMAIDSSGYSKRSEIATVRTSNKVNDYNLPKGHEKQLVLYAAAIMILVIAIACVYHYSKKSLSAKNDYEGKTMKISAENDNIIKADLSEVAETDESESKKGVAETEGLASFKSLTEDYGFVTDINHLLREKRGIDVTFELETPSGETKIFAHQLILAVMSSYFADEFYDKGRNKGHRVIPLKGINPKAFEQMIRYCYGEKPNFKTTEEACILFKIASEFKVISLQSLCCSFFRYTNINIGNVFNILEISEEMEDKSLKDKCCKVLQNKTREVMASYELSDVTPAMVQIILDMPSLSLESEYELIKWIFEWGRAKSEDKDSSCRSTRDYLADLLQNMNFLALTVEEFAILCRANPKVFNSNERASISLNIACPGSWKMPVWYNKNLKCRLYTG